MGLPIIKVPITRAADEYKVPVPGAILERLNKIPSLKTYIDMANATVYFSDFSASYIVFASATGEYDDKYNELYNIYDPNSTFIVFKPTEFEFARNSKYPPQISYYGDNNEKITDLPKIRSATFPYIKSSLYKYNASIPTFNESRELLSLTAIPYIRISYYATSTIPGEIINDKLFFKTISVLELYHCCSDVAASFGNEPPSELITSFNSRQYSQLLKNIRGSFSTPLALDYYKYDSTTSLSINVFIDEISSSSKGDIKFPDFNLANNTDFSYLSVFKNVIQVDDGRDFDKLLTSSDEYWKSRIESGEDVIPDDIGPYDPGGTSTGGGGGGTFDYPDPFDQIGETPVGSAEADSSSLGIFTRYLMSQSSLTRFGDYLYSDNLIDAVVMELMKLLYSTPAEALISLISYPFNVSSLLSSTPSNVFFGNGDTGIASDGRLTKTAAQINWGSILVKGWTGSFLDFSPHTKFDLYLPWCTGTVSLDPSEILTDRSTGISGDVATGQIQIRTNIEIAKGTCMHMVYNGDGVCLGTYSGVCGSQLPITALDTSGKALAFVTAAVSTIASGAAAAAGAATGGTASAARTAGAFSPMSEASQLKQATLNGGHSPAVPNYSRGVAGAQAVSRGSARVAVDSARAAAITPPSISRNGSFTANGSGMSIQYPYLVVSYPERDVPEKYSSHYGYPSNIYKQLGSLDGYTEVAAIHLDGISCTEPELSELDELLKGGVIL